MNHALPLQHGPSAAKRLLEGYKADAYFFLTSPRGALMAQGLSRPLDVGPAMESGTLTETLAKAATDHNAPPLAVGAIPFDPSQPGQLFMPSIRHHAEPLGTGLGRPPNVAPPCNPRLIPEPEEYTDTVCNALGRIQRGEVEKVVLARTLELDMPGSLDLRALLHNLANGNPEGYTFAVDIPSTASDEAVSRTFLGASPELLVSKFGDQVRSNPLAGTATRASDPVEDDKRQHALMRSDKDRREHRVVVEAMADALAPFCRELDVPATPSVMATPKLWHLSTVITGKLKDPQTSSLELARALHPTPAICGHPREPAREAIANLESFDRGLFTGMVGWTDANGDGEWIVAIRCAEAEGRRLRLYAGAGIVEGSDPSAELAETSAKLQTFLSAMGLNDVLGAQ